MFLMYLVMDHMHCICYLFLQSSCTWGVTGTIMNFSTDNRIYVFVCSCIREMKILIEKEDRHMSRVVRISGRVT